LFYCSINTCVSTGDEGVRTFVGSVGTVLIGSKTFFGDFEIIASTFFEGGVLCAA